MSLKDIDPDYNYSEVTEELWQYVYARDNGLCQICGGKGEEEHHLIFKSHGVINSANNLILLCIKCHKINIHLWYDVSVKDLRMRVHNNEITFREALV